MRAKLYPVDRSLLNGPLHSSAAALQKHDRRVTEMLDKRQQHRDNESTGDERRLLHTLEMEAPHIVMRELRAKQQEKGQKPAGNIGYRPKAIDMLMRFPPETTDSVVMRDENITALPHHLDSLNHITHLDVSTNYLLELSPAISELRKLEHLDVSANELSALPDTINLSTRLVTLLARNNRIATLPDRWTGLNYLRELDVSFNRCPPSPHPHSPPCTAARAASTRPPIPAASRFSWSSPRRAVSLSARARHADSTRCPGASQSSTRSSASISRTASYASSRMRSVRSPGASRRSVPGSTSSSRSRAPSGSSRGSQSSHSPGALPLLERLYKNHTSFFRLYKNHTSFFLVHPRTFLKERHRRWTRVFMPLTTRPHAADDAASYPPQEPHLGPPAGHDRVHDRPPEA